MPGEFDDVLFLQEYEVSMDANNNNVNLFSVCIRCLFRNSN